MEKSFAAFTLFTFLLFAVSTARISLESPATYFPVVQSSDDSSKSIKSLPEPARVAEDSNIILPSDKPKSKSDEADHVLETDKSRSSRMFRVGLTPRSDFARFHAINRHFFEEPRIPLRFVHHRPNRHFVNPSLVPRSEISHGNEVILSNVGSENFHHQAPLKRTKLKHDYGHRHHGHQHQHQHQHHLHLHHDNIDVSVPKHRFGREKLKKSFVRQHKANNREHEADFMKSIRKFLKHTFD